MTTFNDCGVVKGSSSSRSRAAIGRSSRQKTQELEEEEEELQEGDHRVAVVAEAVGNDHDERGRGAG